MFYDRPHCFSNRGLHWYVPVKSECCSRCAWYFIACLWLTETAFTQSIFSFTYPEAAHNKKKLVQLTSSTTRKCHYFPLTVSKKITHSECIVECPLTFFFHFHFLCLIWFWKCGTKPYNIPLGRIVTWQMICTFNTKTIVMTEDGT